MPKAQLIFELPEEREEFEDAIQGAKYIAALQEFDNYLRNNIKYGEAQPSTEEIRDMLYELCGKAGFDIWK